MKIISALAFIATLLVSTTALSDPPMKDYYCVKVKHSGYQVISPGHSNFLTPVLFRPGTTAVIVHGSSTISEGGIKGPGPMGCFAVHIVPTATNNFGTSGEAVTGTFDIDRCSFTVHVDTETTLALMVENDDKISHEYDVIYYRAHDTCE